MSPVRTPSAWHLPLAVGAVVVLFVAAAVWSHRLAARLDANAVSIALNASPSIEQLSAARGEVRTSESDVLRAIAADPSDRAADLGAARAGIERLLAREKAYLALPFYPNERSY